MRRENFLSTGKEDEAAWGEWRATQPLHPGSRCRCLLTRIGPRRIVALPAPGWKAIRWRQTMRGPMSEPTLKLRVYEGIKQLILSGKLRPGQKLAERDLGERLKVSRTPIREALGRLVQDGLVESRPQRGHFVREVDAKTVEDLYDLREMLEKHAIRLAMRRLSEADL